MKAHFPSSVPALCIVLATTLLSGCASTATVKPYKYKTTDNRSIVIGRSSASNGGLAFDDPHMDKCWTAGGFDFTGYDTLYIVPITSTAKVHNEEIPSQEVTVTNLTAQLIRLIAAKHIFTNIVIRESDIQPGAKALIFSQTIVDYSMGSGPAARYWLPTGRPDLRIHGVMMDGGKTLFDYTIRRSGTSATSLLSGPWSLGVSDVYLQNADVESMVLDLTDFIAAIAGKYQPQ